MAALANNTRRKRVFEISLSFLTPADQHIYVARQPTKLVAVREVHSVVAAGATLQLRKCTSGTAPASGTAMLASTLLADSTINIPVSGVLSATGSALQLQPGNTIALDVTGTLTNYQGCVTLVLETI